MIKSLEVLEKDSSRRVLSGIETSILAFVDNDTIVPMVSAKDHKKVYNFEKVQTQEEWVLFLQVKSIQMSCLKK